MKSINNLKEYINEDKCKIIILDSKIYISHYLDIKSFESNKFILTVSDKLITLEGNNITIQKLTKEELLISGDIIKIEFR